MIHPTCTEVLATIQTSFETQIVPFLQDKEAQSAAATIGHLLRHVALRIELEGQILSDDVVRLEALLGRIAHWFDEAGLDAPAPIGAALSEASHEGVFPGLDALGERALRLRGALAAAQDALQGLAAHHKSTPGYAALRQEIRSYIAVQLSDEAKLIAPAFQGKGPRR